MRTRPREGWPLASFLLCSDAAIIAVSTEQGKWLPIYMDRHDLRGMTAGDVAEAHRRDVDIQDRHGVKYMAYWFDESNGAAFCLVHAPDPETAERVHREAHGAIAHDIIPVDLATVEAFLGRISDPRASQGVVAPAVDPGLRGVLFTDIVGSTEMTARLGDAAAVELVRVHDALVRRALEAYGGREIKHTGDGIMASFDKAPNAVRAAADIQRRFAAYNAEASETLSVRIGIDAGEPVEDHNDLFGSTVQLASRLCNEAEANGVIVSGFMRELCKEEDPARFVPLGERRFKGFAEKAQVLRFEWRD
jgi:class 3 adenylate cyclase